MDDNKRIKRSNWHDYCERCIYLVTVTVAERRPLLGKVVGDVNRATIELSAMGRAVWYEIGALRVRYPQVRILQHQIMPDHVHLVVFVTERLPKHLPLGNIIASWKAACSKACAALNSEQRDLKVASSESPLLAKGRSTFCDLKVATPDSCVQAVRSSGEAAFRSPQILPLFSKGYNDSILRGRGQLDHIMVYVRDNPRRLLIKQHRRQFFTIHRGLNIAGMAFDAIGNLDLLKQPIVAVHCRSRWNEAELSEYTQRCDEASSRGAVLVGAFISRSEKAIALQAHKKGCPMIHLMENGFPELYKPLGRAFYSCVEGRLLQLAPWPYRSNSQPISRTQCVELNRMAETIAATA